MRNRSSGKWVAFRSLVCLAGVFVLFLTAGGPSDASRTSIDPETYKAFMAAELEDVGELDEWFAEQQLEWMPLLPPAEDFILRQPSGQVLPFNWHKFPHEFKNLVLRYENSVPAYKLTMVEDQKSRTTRFFNEKGKEIFALQSATREPQWYLKTIFQDLFSGKYSPGYVDYMSRLYDSSRVQVELTLVPCEYAEPYLYTTALIAQNAALSSSTPKGGAVLMRYAGPPVTNICITAIERMTNLVRLTIVYPYSGATYPVNCFTNRLDVFRTDDLLEFWWDLAATTPVSSSTNWIEWTDAEVAIPPVTPRIYAAGNADLDSDGDGYADMRERFLYHSDPTNASSHPALVSGAISYSGAETGSVYMLAVAASESWSLGGSVSMPTPDAYSNNRVAIPRAWWFKAFRDANNNHNLDGWEPWALYSAASTYVTSNIGGVNMALQDVPSIWGQLSYTGSVNGDIWIVAVTASNSWDTTYRCVIPWIQSSGLSGEMAVVTFPVNYSIVGMPASNYWIRAFVDSDTNFNMAWPERVGRYSQTAFAVSNRRTAIDFALQDPPSIGGTISYAPYSGGQTGLIYVVAVAASNSCSTNFAQVLPQPGPYRLTAFPEGPCWIWTWRDSDGNRTCGVYEARGYYTNTALSIAGPIDNADIVLTNPDTDDDEMGDWWEMKWFSNLSRVETNDEDGDHLINLYEYYAGADPTAGFVDADGDGMSDDWERWHSLNPNNPADADLDPDQDGWSNLEEYNAQTNPNSLDSQPVGGHYVATNGVDAIGRGSYTNPYATISYALGQASNGHHIIIMPGAYTGSLNRDVDFNGKNLAVTGLQGQRDNTVIDCESSGRAFLIQNGTTSAVIKHLTMRNGHIFYFGGAINADGAMLTVQSCAFISNSITTGYGGAVCGTSGSFVLENCLFTGNIGGSAGGAIYLSGITCLMSRCVFEDNYAREGGALYVTLPIYIDRSVIASNRCSPGAEGIYSTSRTVVENSLLMDNGGGCRGSAIRSMGDLNLVNCTLVDNDAGSLAPLIYLGGTACLTNCILRAANNRVIEGGTWGAAYSCIQGPSPAPGVGNINTDPNFQRDGWHLMPDSPCRNAGTNLSRFAVEADLDGAPRIQDQIVDIGADELGVYYVDKYNSSPSVPFITWATAATNIQDAIDAAWVGSFVLVSNGVYDSGMRIVGDGIGCRVALLKDSVHLQSVNGPSVTTISGSGPELSTRCLYAAAKCTVDGFTLYNGHTDNSGGTLSQDGGGAWCEEDVRIANCIITGCLARLGGGLYTAADSYSLFAEDNLFTRNQARGMGGALYLGGDARLAQCSFNGNSAATGGAVFVGSYLDLTNSIFLCNTGLVGGAVVIHRDGMASIWGSLFANNNAFDKGGAISSDGESDFVQCCFSSNLAAIGGALAGCSDLYLSNCLFSGNSAIDGGAISARSNGILMAANCSFEDNNATSVGGAIDAECESYLADCGFTNNSSAIGGALKVSANLNLENSRLNQNTALNGGAVVVQSNGLFRAAACRFEDNHAVNQGGALMGLGVFSLSHCRFIENTASTGGAIAASSQVDVNTSLFHSNVAHKGGAFYSSGHPGYPIRFMNCTLVNNSADNCGHALFLDNTGVPGSYVTMTNCIVWGFVSNNVWGTNWSFAYSCLQDSLIPPGPGNLNSNPLFAPDGWHLSHASPCLNTGSNTSGMEMLTDLDGDARILEAVVDIGADECAFNRFMHMPSYDQSNTWGVSVVGVTTRIWMAATEIQTNQWPLSCWFDLGDGHHSATITVTQTTGSRYIGTEHVYSTSSIYDVNAYLSDSRGVPVTLDFQLACRETNNFDALALLAAENGLIWLYTNAFFHAHGYYWQHDNYGTSYIACANSLAITAFASLGHRPSCEDDIYEETISGGLRYLLIDCLQAKPISTDKCNYNPDANSNGLGIGLANSNNEMYQLGSIMTAFIESAWPTNVAPENAPGNIAGRSYRDIMQDMADYCGWAQTDDGYGRGGWRYSANHESSDNSASWWSAVGLYHAQTWDGISIPNGLRAELAAWIAYSQNDNGYFGYDGPSYGTSARTSYGLAQLAFLNRTFTNTEVQLALNYLNANSIPEASDLYGMHAFGAACDMFDPPIEMIGAQNWRYACATNLLSAQRTDGAWLGNYAGQLLGTASAISILAETAPGRINVLNVGQVPQSAYSNDTVYIHAKILPRADLTNLALRTWYRAGTNGVFTLLSMTNAFDVYYTATPIPAQPPQTKVEYFLQSEYSKDGASVTQRYPSAHLDHCFSYSVNQ